MKSRLNLTIYDRLLTKAKEYACKEQISLSELVENYFTMLTKRTKKKSIIDLIESLYAATKIAEKINLKDLFYNVRQKHDF
jgi:bifunctional DNase/RNase